MPTYPPPPGDKAPTPTNKFDYVTRLITQHEQQVTQQSIQLSELTRKLVDIENKQIAELSVVEPLRDRNVVSELDSLRRQLDTLSRRLQEEVAGETRTLALGLLQSDVQKLKDQVADLSQWQGTVKDHIQQTVAACMAEVRSGLLDTLRQELGAVVGAVREEVSAVRAESAAAATSVEAATLTTHSLAVKLRAHLQGTNNALTAITGKVDQQSSAVTQLTSDVQGLEADSKKIKKHVVRLEKQTEGLQTLGQVAVNTDRVVCELRREVESTVATHRTMTNDVQVAVQGVQSLTTRVSSLESDSTSVKQLAKRTRAELGAMAESLSATLHQLSEAQRKVAYPGGLLSSLLGPPPTLSGGSGMSRLGLQGYAGQSSLMLQGSHAQHDTQAADQSRTMTEPFDSFLHTFRSQSHLYAPPSLDYEHHVQPHDPHKQGQHRQHSAPVQDNALPRKQGSTVSKEKRGTWAVPAHTRQ